LFSTNSILSTHCSSAFSTPDSHILNDYVTGIATGAEALTLSGSEYYCPGAAYLAAGGYFLLASYQHQSGDSNGIIYRMLIQ
jgi:hypothetical protein